VLKVPLNPNQSIYQSTYLLTAKMFVDIESVIT